MKTNKLFTFLALILILSIFILPAYARGGCKKCSKGKGKLESKFFCKAKFLFVHQDMLGLSDKQAKEIKELKIATKKYLIKSKADIEIIAVDIKSMLYYSDKIDTKAIEKLIDQKYKIKKDKTKTLVSSYSKICDMLTEEQLEVLKGLKLKMQQQSPKCMKCHGSKPMKMMCPRLKAPEAGSK